jgi:hypothetical protein
MLRGDGGKHQHLVGGEGWLAPVGWIERFERPERLGKVMLFPRALSADEVAALAE